MKRLLALIAVSVVGLIGCGESNGPGEEIADRFSEEEVTRLCLLHETFPQMVEEDIATKWQGHEASPDEILDAVLDRC